MPGRFVSYRSRFYSNPSLVGIIRESSDRALVAPCVISGCMVASLYDLIEDWDKVQDLILEGEPCEPLANVEILAPLVGRDVLAVAKNFRDHVKEMDASKTDALPEAPMIFTKRATSIIPAGSSICVHPESSSMVDYEGEIAIIIGKAGKNIKKDNAWDYVWGATILNDVTARDRQKLHKQFYVGKSFDTFCPLGPFAVHASQLDWMNMSIETRVNNKLRQKGSMSDLIFDVPTLVETCSAGITLQPGDIIATGTPAGVAAGQSPPPWLKPGDTVSVSVTGLGTLTSPVAASVPPCEAVRSRENRLGAASTTPPDSRFITISSGKTIAYESQGPTDPKAKQDVPTIVFVHGTGVSSIGFYPLIEASGISSTHRVITFDADGNGRSPLSKPFDLKDEKLKKTTHLESFAEDVRQLLSALGISKPVILVGHSMGALISLLLAARHPELVSKLFLLAPASSTRPYSIPAILSRAQEINNTNSIEFLIPFLTSASLSKKSRSHPLVGPFATSLIRSSYLACEPQAYVRACIALANSTQPIEWAKINERNIPTMIVVGSEDKFTPPEKDSECIRKGLKGCEMKVIKNVGHWPHLEALQETAKHFKAFVYSKTGVIASSKL